MGAITKERWLQAQEAERNCHQSDFSSGFQHYRIVYKHTFRYLGMSFDQNGKRILEVGPADFPALAYCHNYRGVIVEPMPSPHLSDICREREIEVLTNPVEEIDLPQVDEAWIFNVLQHVIDPDLLVEKCKEAASVVRYFEPVDYPTCEYHPHTFSEADFIRWFGETKRYTDRGVERFFDADCCYGNWKR